MSQKGTTVELEAEPTADVINRLRRVQGQVGGIIAMLDQGRDCAEIVTQLAAASRALDRAGFKLLSAGMRQCLTAEVNGDREQMSAPELERLFLSLA